MGLGTLGHRQTESYGESSRATVVGPVATGGRQKMGWHGGGNWAGDEGGDEGGDEDGLARIVRRPQSAGAGAGDEATRHPATITMAATH